MKPIYLIGGGGHCKSCIDVIESTGEFKIAGIFDRPEKVGQMIGTYKIIGSDENIQDHVLSENFFLITIGQIKSSAPRARVAALLQSLKANVATIISKRAYVAGSAKIGPGTIVMHDVLVNSEAVIGSHCILNTKSLVEHEAIIADFCHVSTAAVINGNVKIEAESFIGSSSVLEEGMTVPAKSILSAGKFHRKPKV